MGEASDEIDWSLTTWEGSRFSIIYGATQLHRPHPKSSFVACCRSGAPA